MADCIADEDIGPADEETTFPIDDTACGDRGSVGDQVAKNHSVATIWKSALFGASCLINVLAIGFLMFILISNVDSRFHVQKASTVVGVLPVVSAALGGKHTAQTSHSAAQIDERAAVHPSHDGGTVLSWSPRIVALEHFLSVAEADYLLQLAASRNTHYGRTALVGINGNSVPGSTITSKISTIAPQDPVVENITRRMAAASLVPEEHMEYLHFLKYEPNNFFRGHIDAHALAGRPTTSRLATFFLYLNDVPEEDGGETFFPPCCARRAGIGQASLICTPWFTLQCVFTVRPKGSTCAER